MAGAICRGFSARRGRRRLRCRSAAIASAEPQAAISSCGQGRISPSTYRGYAGIDLVVGDLPRVVDANPRPTTSIVGISKVMREELADLILRVRISAVGEGDGGSGVRVSEGGDVNSQRLSYRSSTHGKKENPGLYLIILIRIMVEFNLMWVHMAH